MRIPYGIIYGIQKPVITLILSHNNIKVRTLALIDSGADISLFDADLAEVLGLKLKSGESVPIRGIGGEISGYRHVVKMTIGRISFQSTVVFTPTLGLNPNLLGRDNFFEHFLITFDETAKEVILKKQGTK